MENSPMKSSRWTSVQTLHAFFLGLGLLLFIVLLARLGAQGILQRLARIGWMFVPAFLAYVSSQFLSTMTWMSCVPSGSSRASYWDLLQVFWAGHALNAVTPGGGMGEALKVSLLRGKVGGRPLVASLILYNVINTTSVAAASVIGAVLCVVWLDAPLVATVSLLIGALAVALGVLVLLWLVRRGTLSKALGLIQRLPFVSFRDPQAIADHATDIDGLMCKFFHERPHDVLRAMLFASGARLAQVVEMWCLLYPLVTEGNVFLIAVLAHTTSTLTSWATAFVPGQVGTLEGGNAAVFQLAGLDPVLGVTAIIARRLRTALGVGIGLLLGGRVTWQLRRSRLGSQNG